MLDHLANNRSCRRVTNRLFKACLVTLLLSTCLPVVAQSLQLADFANATVVSETEKYEQDYRLTLGSMKKANSRWFAEREQRLSGELKRKTLQLDEGFKAEEAFNFYRRQLLEHGGRELFHCVGRDCGSSNSWANERFGVRQLYGLDQYQWYSAFEVAADSDESAGGSFYVALYAVTRGNKRNYLHLEQLWDVRGGHLAASPKTILESLQNGAAYQLPDLKIQGTTVSVPGQHLQALVESMGLSPRMKVYLVGHDYKRGSLTEQQERSRQYAQSLKDQLVDAGIEGDRLQVEGIGSLAPGSRIGRLNRVEVVLP